MTMMTAQAENDNPHAKAQELRQVFRRAADAAPVAYSTKRG